MFIVVSLSVVLTNNVKSNPAFKEWEDIKKLENPISVCFLKSQLRNTSPRLILTQVIERITHPELTFSIISLDSSPFYLDRRIEGLKRIKIHIPARTIEGGKGNIKARFSGE